jgi:3-deoxy-manno-octulosonate cytidylyltransferase (CMP-KDO synthetase)
MLQRVYEQAIQAEGIDAVYIATDSQEIQAACQPFTDNIIMTASTHLSGTDRIAEAISQIPCDVVVNVQGDEPFISPGLISAVAHTLIQNNAPMSSAMKRIGDIKDLQDPNCVKVVVNQQRQALYFSRSPIPYDREGDLESSIQNHSYYRHIGIYGYTKTFLQQYSQLPMSPLEQIERLEQLRVLEHGFGIQMIETTESSLGIDTTEDYQKALERLKEQHASH